MYLYQKKNHQATLIESGVRNSGERGWLVSAYQGFIDAKESDH